jgi:hypothetical protein
MNCTFNSDSKVSRFIYCEEAESVYAREFPVNRIPVRYWRQPSAGASSPTGGGVSSIGFAVVDLSGYFWRWF